MAGERYRHIFLPGPTRSDGFTSTKSRGSSFRIPTRDPAEHSSYLQRRLEETWLEEGKLRERQAVIHVERYGAYVEFASEPGFDLVTESLERTRSGIRLLNVRKEGEGTSERTLATVYVPSDKRGHFLRQIQAYATEIDARTNKPKNARLVSSISDIRLAVLKSFWPHDQHSAIPGDTPQWVETWLSSDQVEVLDRFEGLLRAFEVESADGLLRFPERTVKLIRADRNQLTELIAVSDDVAEFRLAKELATFFIELPNPDQVDWLLELRSRCNYEDDNDVAICILDTGVNNGHSLIQPVLADSDLHTVREEWGKSDHDGHGTLMAGIAVYGDLLSHLNGRGPVRIAHRLESAKILPPPPERNPKKLWGYVTVQGISRAEIQEPLRRRIVCVATTAMDDRDRGRPSSWSGAIDELASGYQDDVQRLIIVSAGNTEGSVNWCNYPGSNLTSEVHDPGQAWNAMTVGAFTEKTRITHSTLSSYVAIAPPGGLSPYSTTSVTWPERKWPIKPEVVLEGGNVARGPNNSTIDADDLKLLSTYRYPQVAQFAPFCATSAAAAQAAWMAAQIQVAYPEAWPETIRGLIMHSASWTQAMKDQFLRDGSKASYARLLRICGYGVPSLDQALYCAANSLTLISQATLQPFDKRDGRCVTRDMHLYSLPWPTEVLSGLGETQVSMRVTLSYFVEPSPGEIGWGNRYRYASHALRFDVNGSGEFEEEFVRRINKQARDDGERPDTEGSGQNWTIGEARNVGSIHSDIWRGRAADLANSNKIAVYPAAGWWKERTNQKRWSKSCRYALIVSIQTPAQDIDIYTPVAIKLGVAIPVPVGHGAT
ncbi:MAG: S8 family peptidase [Pseudomonadaceae bacterium]